MIVLLLVLIVVPIIIVSWVSYFISARAFKSLEKNNNKNARALAGLIFITCFAVLGAITYFLIISNIRLGR